MMGLKTPSNYFCLASNAVISASEFDESHLSTSSSLDLMFSLSEASILC